MEKDAREKRPNTYAAGYEDGMIAGIAGMKKAMVKQHMSGGHVVREHERQVKYFQHAGHNWKVSPWGKTAIISAQKPEHVGDDMTMHTWQIGASGKFMEHTPGVLMGDDENSPDTPLEVPEIPKHILEHARREARTPGRSPADD